MSILEKLFATKTVKEYTIGDDLIVKISPLRAGFIFKMTDFHKALANWLTAFFGDSDKGRGIKRKNQALPHVPGESPDKVRFFTSDEEYQEESAVVTQSRKEHLAKATERFVEHALSGYSKNLLGELIIDSLRNDEAFVHQITNEGKKKFDAGALSADFMANVSLPMLIQLMDAVIDMNSEAIKSFLGKLRNRLQSQQQ